MKRLFGIIGLILLASPLVAQTADTVTTTSTTRVGKVRQVSVTDSTITITVTRTITIHDVVPPPTTPTLTKITISPKTWSMQGGTTQFFILTPTWSDGAVRAVTATWTRTTGGTVSPGTGGGLYSAGTVSGSFKVIADASGKSDTCLVTITGTVSPPVDTTTPPPPIGSYPNKPASLTRTSGLDFSQPIPSLPDNVDRPIPGAPAGWNMIYFGTSWTSAGGQWTGRWDTGSFGGGVIGQGDGHGIGNVFAYPGSVTRLYLSIRAYFDMTASQWHPISNKFVNIECNNSLILVQLRENNPGHWRHVEELGFVGGSWYIDPDPTQFANEPHLAGQIANPPVPVRQWTQIEVLVDLPAKTLKVWQDGILTTDGKNLPFKSTSCHTPGLNAFRGGGGETITAAFTWRYEDLLIAY